MSDHTLIPMGAVKAAMTRLENHRRTHYVEFWEYLAEEIDTAGWNDTPNSGSKPTAPIAADQAQERGE